MSNDLIKATYEMVRSFDAKLDTIVERVAIVETKVKNVEVDMEDRPTKSSVDVKIQNALEKFEDKMEQRCEKKMKNCSKRSGILNLSDKQKTFLLKVGLPLLIAAFSAWAGFSLPRWATELLNVPEIPAVVEEGGTDGP